MLWLAAACGSSGATRASDAAVADASATIESGNDSAPGPGVDATAETGAGDAADLEAEPAPDQLAPPADASPEAAPCVPQTADPVYAVYAAVDPARLVADLKVGASVTAVDLGGDAGPQIIQNRYTPAMKALFRAYFEQQMSAAGLSWHEMTFPTTAMLGESMGHDVEAVVPGASADSVVVIVHYDSTGVAGHEAENPGADDDMTGLATMFESARVLSNPRFKLARTVRFVLSDYEEEGSFEGAHAYASWIVAQAADAGFTVVAAQDYEQSGWNCASDGACSADAGGQQFLAADCSGDALHFSNPALGDSLVALATQVVCSPVAVQRGCLGENSDHYAMWQVGVPALVTSETDPFANPHFDQNGGDTFDKLDTTYHERISRLVIAFTAKLAGVQLAD